MSNASFLQYTCLCLQHSGLHCTLLSYTVPVACEESGHPPTPEAPGEGRGGGEGRREVVERLWTQFLPVTLTAFKMKAGFLQLAQRTLNLPFVILPQDLQKTKNRSAPSVCSFPSTVAIMRSTSLTLAVGETTSVSTIRPRPRTQCSVL